MNLSAVIFDLDGLLIDTESLSRATWLQAANDFGFEFTESLYGKIAGRSIDSARTIIAASIGGIDIDRYMKVASDLYFQWLEDEEIAVMEGVYELVDFLDQHSIRYAVATSTTKVAAIQKLHKTGLDQIFQIIVTSEEVSHGKPAPDLFVLTAEKLGVAADECIVIEDAEAGIVGAHKAGMYAIMVPSTRAPSQATIDLAYAVETSLLDVIPLLENQL